MWLLIFLFGLTTLAVVWICFAYFIFTYIISLMRPRRDPRLLEDPPMLSLVIPCYNESAEILEKLENTRALNYPRDRLEVVFVDGGSQDDTVTKLQEALREDWIRIAVSPRVGKIQQVNEVLPTLRGDIVVNSDADALLAPDALLWLAAEIGASQRIGVVGAYCRPLHAMELDQHFWAGQNRARFLESDAGSASIVVAPCYAYRRELLTQFPEDVVADDIYVAYLAHSLGYEVVYSRKAQATEFRGPQSYPDYVPHKFRKANAFLRESLRFLYRLPEMRPFCKIMFLTRLSQQLLMPWALLSWVLLAGALLTLYRIDIVILGTVLIAGSLLVTGGLFSWIELPDGKRKFSLVTLVQGYLMTNLILSVTALSYPFVQQGSSYARLDGAPRRVPRDASAPSR